MPLALLWVALQPAQATAARSSNRRAPCERATLIAFSKHASASAVRPPDLAYQQPLQPVELRLVPMLAVAIHDLKSFAQKSRALSSLAQPQ